MNGNESEKPTNRAFEIDDRICIMIERDLSSALGQLILDTDTTNPALLAIGHQLRNLDRGSNKSTA
jgi:hypothetical protein